jgi:hypothetical protein
MASIIFEDEDVVDLGLVPDATCQAEEKKEKVGQEVAGVQLQMSVSIHCYGACIIPAEDNLCEWQTCCPC